MPRTFIAVQIDAAPPLRQVIDAMSRMGRAIRPVSPQQLHVTLRFLGDTDEQLLPLISEAMHEATGGVGAFEIELAGVGAFPRVERPSVVWAGARGDEWLAAIVEQLNPLIDTLDFEPVRRPWTTHLTLARVKARPPRELFNLFDQYRDASFGDVSVRSIELMASELRPDGPVYSVIESVELK